MSALLLSKVDRDTYALVGSGGDIGFVRKVFRTIEKEIPGESYVAWRRTAKTPSWKWWLKGDREPGGNCVCYADTRKQAVERLMADQADRERQS